MKKPLENVRLDRWLFAARFYKTRSQAVKACEGNKVKVNGLTAKPHKTIRIGDKIILHHRTRYRNLEVLALAERGLPPKVARELYLEEIDQSLSEESKELLGMINQLNKKSRPKYKGRPTKRERRKIDGFRDKMTNI